MKTFKVKGDLEHESYSGYTSQDGRESFIVDARNSEIAIKKARRLAYPYSLKCIFVEKVEMKQVWLCRDNDGQVSIWDGKSKLRKNSFGFFVNTDKFSHPNEGIIHSYPLNFQHIFFEKFGKGFRGVRKGDKKLMLMVGENELRELKGR